MVENIKPLKDNDKCRDDAIKVRVEVMNDAKNMPYKDDDDVPKEMKHYLN